MTTKKSPSLKSLKAKAWKVFSEYIRKRGADEGGTNTCITCGKLAHWKELHAGHFVGGRRNAVLFNEDLTHPQCVTCNIFLGGNYQAYTLKMLDMYGRDKVDEFLALKHKTVKLTRADFVDIIDMYRYKIRLLSTAKD